MKTIGLIGGMSWESTVLYYTIINETIKEQLGGLHSARILLYSVDFYEIEQYQATGDWDASARVLQDAALRLQQAGADFLVICTNTMHKVVPLIQPGLSIPILHIAEATSLHLRERGITQVGLLGTRYTMEQDFYIDKLRQAGLEVLIPAAEDRQIVNAVIYDELCLGTILEPSRAAYLRIIDDLSQRGAQGVILGCTEIGLLISADDTSLPVFDTTRIHAVNAALCALEGTAGSLQNAKSLL